MVGLRVREIRKRAGMTQEQFGEAMGGMLARQWPRQTVSDAEKGARSWTAVELVAAAEVLDVTVVGLLTAPISDDKIEMPSGRVLDSKEMRALVAGEDSDHAAVLDTILHTAARLDTLLAGAACAVQELADLHGHSRPHGLGSAVRSGADHPE